MKEKKTKSWKEIILSKTKMTKIMIGALIVIVLAMFYNSFFPAVKCFLIERQLKKGRAVVSPNSLVHELYLKYRKVSTEADVLEKISQPKITGALLLGVITVYWWDEEMDQLVEGLFIVTDSADYRYDWKNKVLVIKKGYTRKARPFENLKISNFNNLEIVGHILRN